MMNFWFWSSFLLCWCWGIYVYKVNRGVVDPVVDILFTGIFLIDVDLLLTYFLLLCVLAILFDCAIFEGLVVCLLLK